MAKVVTYLKGDALAWWRDVGQEQLGTAVSFLQFKTAFLAKFVKASDSLTARIDLEACKHEGLSVEAYAYKFQEYCKSHHGWLSSGQDHSGSVVSERAEWQSGQQIARHCEPLCDDGH